MDVFSDEEVSVEVKVVGDVRVGLLTLVSVSELSKALEAIVGHNSVGLDEDRLFTGILVSDTEFVDMSVVQDLAALFVEIFTIVRILGHGGELDGLGGTSEKKNSFHHV